MEAKTDTAVGLDGNRAIHVMKDTAQVVELHLDPFGACIEVDAPDSLENLFSRNNLLCTLRQQHQQLKGNVF